MLRIEKEFAAFISWGFVMHRKNQRPGNIPETDVPSRGSPEAGTGVVGDGDEVNNSKRPNKVVIARSEATRQSHEIASPRTQWQGVHTYTIPFTVKGHSIPRYHRVRSSRKVLIPPHKPASET